jgi:hypothetical protein
MQDSRLFKTLQTIDKEEFKAFGKFVQSPFFNLRNDVTLLWECLYPYLQKPAKLPSRVQIFEKIYGSKDAFDDHRLRMCMSFLVKTTEAYFAWKNFQKNPIRNKIHLAAEYRNRGLEQYFDKTQEESIQLLENNPHRNAEHLEDLYLLKLESFKAAAAQKRTEALPFQEVYDTFEHSFLAQKLRQACVALSHQAVYRTEYDFGMLPEVLAYIEQRKIYQLPAIGVYYFAFRMMSGVDDAYQDFKISLEQNLAFFPENEQHELILHAINHCIKQYNAGNSTYLEEELIWYKKGLETKVLLSNGILSRFTYRNVATLALVSKDFKWASTFIHDFKNCLEPSQREANFAFNLARLEYEQKNYGIALDLLQQSDYEDTLLALAAKTVLLKVYYETKEFDVLDSHLEAMQTFIRRHKEIGYHAENYRQLVRFTKILSSFPPGNSKEKAKFRLELEGTKSVAERIWLLEKFL